MTLEEMERRVDYAKASYVFAKEIGLVNFINQLHPLVKMLEPALSLGQSVEDFEKHLREVGKSWVDKTEEAAPKAVAQKAP